MTLLLLALVSPAQAGIIIGNPPQLMPRVLTLDASADHLFGDVVRTDLTACSGAVSTLVHAEAVDMVGEWRPFFPAGEWCGLTVTFAGPPLRCDWTGCEAALPEDLDLAGPDGLTVDWVVLPGPVATGW